MNVTVVSKSEHGLRRAGRFWPTTPVTADVTETQLRELKADKRIASPPARWPGSVRRRALHGLVRTAASGRAFRRRVRRLAERMGRR
jgi:hypothetical protein